MEHVVFFTGADGAAQFRRTPSLDEAVRLVEHLRNVEGVEDVRVFSMTEVPLAFKAVYRVEIPGATPVPAEPSMPVEPVAEPVADVVPLQVAVEPEPAEVEPEPVIVPAEPFAAEVYVAQPEHGANGKHGARGLGFFSR